MFDQNTAGTFAGVVSGTGSLTQSGTGALTLTGANSWRGGTMISAGTLSVSSDSNLGATAGDLTLNGGTLENAASFTLDHTLKLGANGGTLEIGAGTDLTVANAITGAGSLTQTGAAGTLTPDNNVTTGGAQTYNGAVMLGGNVTFTSTGTGANGAIDFVSTVDGAHNLMVNTGGLTTFGGAVGGTTALTSLTTNSGSFSANALTINGPLSVTTTASGNTQGGAFTVSGTSSFNAGANAITLTNASNAFTGAVSLTGGNVSLTNNTAITLGTSTVSGTLAVGSNGALTESGALTVAGAATFTQNSTTAGTTQDIKLGTQANDFKAGVTFAAGAGASINNLSLENTDATPGTLTLPTSVAGNLTLNYTNAALTVPVVGVGGTLDVTAADGITINGNVTTGLDRPTTTP